MPPPIQQLAERLIEERGLEYMMTYKALKLHIKSLSDIQFLAEMTRIDNPKVISCLYSVGLSLRQQEMAMARWKELTVK